MSSDSRDQAMVQTLTPKSSLATNRQMLAALGVRDRIIFPFSPRKVVAALHYLADLRSSPRRVEQDRKSTRLNSSHSQISYAVFCLKKKKKYIFCLFVMI